MRRAKHIDRAEARRRYRASLEAQAVATDDADGSPVPNRLTDDAVPNRVDPTRKTAGTKGRAPDPLASAPVAARPGLRGAISGAIRPLDLRGDLRILPALVFRSKAIWVPTVIVVLSGIAILVPSLRDNSVVALAAPLFIVPPPMAAPFLAGILAPRAAWLAGAIVSVIAGIFYSIYVATVTVAPAPGAAPITTDVRVSTIVSSMLVSLVFGAFVGGFAGFYRRFLKLSSPNTRGQRPATKVNSRRPAKATARR